MSAVIDASVLVAATTDAGPDGVWAEQVIEAGDLVAPHLAQVEATNILRRLERAGLLTKLEATSAQRDLVELDLILMPFAPFAERVWELRGQVTSYDAWRIAIAEALGLPLATLDRRMSRTKAVTCRFLLPG